ncbi:MAG: serine/threonine-protein kinase, partial [Planctomycetota bacterium]
MSGREETGDRDVSILLGDLLGQFSEAWLNGERPDHSLFVQRAGAHAEELRAKIDAFLYVAEDFRGLGPDGNPELPGVPRDPEGPLDTTLGDFRLIREIGRGGMGVVYEAEQISLSRRVALKVLPAHLTLHQRTVERFRREAAAASRLLHPGIVEVFCVGQEEGTHFFAMEYVRGAPLDRVIEELSARPPGELDGAAMGLAVSRTTAQQEGHDHSEAGREPRRRAAPAGVWSASYIATVCQLVARVADALAHAHREGVIHRDVKPANILIRGDGSAVLTDFGLAQQADLQSLTLSGDLAGTPHYLSPERAQPGETEVDHRTDIFSLGVTLYELLTLRRPFEGRTLPVLSRRIATSSPTPIRKLNPQVPVDLETICTMALEKSPDRRYQTAA